MVTEVSTFLIIPQVSNGLKLRVLIFGKCKYLHAKIASLTTVKSGVNVWPCPITVDELSTLVVAQWILPVLSCNVKLQLVLSGLERKAKTLDIHMHFCGFFNIHSIHFLSTLGVI